MSNGKDVMRYSIVLQNVVNDKAKCLCRTEATLLAAFSYQPIGKRVCRDLLKCRLNLGAEVLQGCEGKSTSGLIQEVIFVFRLSFGMNFGLHSVLSPIRGRLKKHD